MSSSLLSPSSIGDVNRSRVLRVLCDQGPMSRAELAKVTGVTRATVGNIVQSLIDSGLLEEGEPRTGVGRVGKPGRPVWFGREAGRSMAIAVHSDSVEAAVVSARGDVLEHVETSLDGEGENTEAITRSTLAVVERLPAQDELLGVGIAVPGVCDTERGVVLGSGQLPGLAGKHLVDALRDRFDQPVLVDNDSRAQALGEKWFGLGRGRSTFVSVQTGQGLGVGIVLGGTVFRGLRGRTGELGHTCIDPEGSPCRCGLRGCWETIATLRWLRAEARRLRLPDARRLDAATLMALAERSTKADDLATRYAENLGIGLANLAQLLDPELVILHGDVVSGGEELRRRIEDAVRSRALAYLRPAITVTLSSLDQRATLLGAAGLVLSETFNHTR